MDLFIHNDPSVRTVLKFIGLFRKDSVISLVLWSLLFFVVVSFFWVGYGHIPYYEFDEANTIAISHRSYVDISTILSYEQNVPSYYFLLHLLFDVFGDSRVLWQIVHFGIWAVSLILFYFLLRRYVFSQKWLVFGVLLYSLISSISYYSFTIRMYGLINLLVVIYLLVYLKRSFLISFFKLTLLVVLCLLHPFNLVFVALVTLDELIRMYQRKSYAGFFGVVCGLFLSLFIVCLEVLPKNLNALVFGAQAQYLFRFRNLFFEFPSILFFKQNSLISVPFYLSLVYVLYISIKRRKIPLLLLLFLSFSFILHIFLPSFLNLRHFIFIITPLFLVVFLSLYHLPVFSYRISIALFWFAAFFLSTLQTVNFELYERGLHTEMCLHLSELKDTVLLTDTHTLYSVLSCSVRPPVFLVHPTGVWNVLTRNPLDIFILRAQIGGKLTFHNSQGIDIEGETRALREFITSSAYERYSFVLTWHSYPLMTSYQLDPFTGFIYEGYLAPSIFTFRKPLHDAL
jgi:hypothetical protein